MNQYIHGEFLDASISTLHTEMRNPKTERIAESSTLEMLRMINDEDITVAYKVQEQLPQVAKAIEYILPRMQKGGRMVYCAAGTSARLGFMDAAECPPTYGVADDTVTCLMAGGRECVFHANELQEDYEMLAVKDLEAFGLKPEDTVVAAAASGRTPYGIGALKYAQQTGAGRVAIACNPNSEMGKYAEVAIEVDTGAEAMMGSTRMKAGTAQKMVMNMLSTGLLVRLGHSAGNVLAHRGHFKDNNKKIINRRVRALAEITGNPDLEHARDCLEKANGCIVCASLAELTGIDYETAGKICEESNDNYRAALEKAREITGKQI